MQGAAEFATLTAEIAALGPFTGTVQQLKSWFNNRRGREARTAREAREAGAGAGSRAAAEEDKSRAASREGRRPPETNVFQQHMGPQVAAAAGTLPSAAAAVGTYPSAPATAAERYNLNYLDDKGLRRDEWGKLYKDSLTADGDPQRIFYPEDCAGILI
jgi:hypothetical protein